MEVDPQHLHALNHLGVSLHQLGKFQDALAVFKQLESSDAEYEPSYCNRIRIYTELGDHQSAEEMFYTARLYRDQCPTCYFNMGISLAARGLYDRAVYCWQRTIDLSGDDVAVHARIADALARCGRTEQARRHYVEGLRISPDDVTTLLDLTSLLIDMGRLDEAALRLSHAEKLAGATASVAYMRGKYEWSRGRWNDATHALRAALQLDPTFEGANLLLAKLSLEENDLPAAKAYLRAEVMLRPACGHLLLDLANMLLDVREQRLAVACLRRLTQAEPANVKAWQNLAVAECARSRYDRGVSASLYALELDPGNIAVRHNLALAYMQSGQLDYAREELAHALFLCPRDRALKRLQFRLRLRGFFSTLWGS